MSKRERSARWSINVLLLAGSSILFAFSHPNFFVYKGGPLCAYFALFPLFVLIRRISLPASFVWGGIYGALSYSLFAYWLFIFHPLTIYIIALQYCIYCMLLIPLLKLADMYFPRYGFIIQWLLWIGYEYCKTLGFLGFSYGIMGYSQWSFVPLIQIASLFGIWAVSALVCFPAAWFAAAWNWQDSLLKNPYKRFSAFMRMHILSIGIWIVCFVGACVFGMLYEKDYRELQHRTVALIQPNADPWIGGFDAYKHELNTLKALSDEALNNHSDLDLIVWPETAFIPRICWHYRYREDAASFELVHNLLTYVDAKNIPFLIGNDDAVRALNADGFLERVDYNGALLFRPKKNVLPPQPERYRKMHLVPFTEHFPYRKQFPFVYDALVANDTHFWTKGTEPTVFLLGSMRFAVPICFEDTFGYISRRFAQKGANTLINMSNDAWAQSIPCQNQHVSMAVFRAVENRLPLLRATASGQTVSVSPHGRITAMLKPFEKGYLCAEVPVFMQPTATLYTTIGDIFGIICGVLGSIVLLAGILKTFLYKRKTV